MITFTRAPTVAPGELVTSTQFRLLSRAFNDRIRAGLDCDYRIVWYWFNLFRQVRNPDASGVVFPAQAEFFDIYQHLDPEYHEGTTWPEQGPGLPEGANLSNPMMQFVFGIEDPGGGPGLDSEDFRLALPFLLTPTPTIEDYWELAKAQRGAYDPLTTAQAAPAFDAAQQFFKIVQPFWSPHGKAYGGWQPTPELVVGTEECGDGDIDGDGVGVPNYHIKFSALRPDVPATGFHGGVTTVDGKKVVTYAGSCPCGSDSFAPGHVLGIYYGAFNYYVFVGQGTGDIVDGCPYDVDVFAVKDWIEGPYTGEGRLKHTVGNQLDRVLSFTHLDHRGTPAQRDPDTFDIEAIAFDNQRFFTSQYPLSPNIGAVEGAAVVPRYPRAEFSVANGNTASGSLGKFGATSTSHQYRDGFVLGGVFAKATALTSPCVVEFLDGDDVLTQITLTPESGTAYGLEYLADAGTVNLRVRLDGQAQFSSGDGKIVCEATEQHEYKPEFWDAYLVSRLGASNNGDAFGGGVDGRGLDNSGAREMGEAFFATGAITQPLGVRQILDWVNDHPVFDNARRASRRHMRVLRRQQLISYEVTGGKSVLRFKRFAQYTGIDGVELRADLFDGIAPPIDPVESGKLVENETYIVRAGEGAENRITYLGGTYHNGQTFKVPTGNTLNPDWFSYEAHGDAAVYVLEGIRSIARKGGVTNEWVGFLQTKCYHLSPSSIWKPEAYADYFALNNRCHFYSGTANAALRRFFNFNNSTSPLDPDTTRPVLNPMSVQANFISPEAPSGYNYAMGANTHGSGSGENFYKSCQIYEAPWEIESCIVEDAAPLVGGRGDQNVKLTLKTRLRSHPDAPATVDKDPLAWSGAERDALAAEDYRTPDNALREYLLSRVDGGRNCTFKIGDSGTGSIVHTIGDDPFGSCYPHLFLVHLVEEPYEDDNDTTEPHDTRCTVDAFRQMELYLRAICEGFMDGQTSKEIVCATRLGNIYDFTFENLCFQAFSGRSIGALSLKDRPDFPAEFGPLPNTIMEAELFNRLSSAVNLLDKARLDLPIRFKSRQHNYRDDRNVTLIELDGTICNDGGGTCKAYGDNLSGSASTETSVDGWLDWTTIGAINAGQLIGCPYQFAATASRQEYRVVIADPDDPDFIFFNAVPQALRDQIEGGGTGFLALRTTTIQTEQRESVAEADADRCPTDPPTGPAFWTADGGGAFYRWVSISHETVDCILVSSGTLAAPGLQASDYKIGRAGGIPCGNNASSSVRLDLIAEQNAYLLFQLVDGQ